MKTLNPGDRFGSYRVVKQLGKGGMGEVWLMESVESGTQVAAKILNPEDSADHDARKRFVREAELAMGVKDENLIEVYDVGEDPDTGLCYIMMEYVPGGTLADYLKENGALPIDDAVVVVHAIARVLEKAREKGIVHRDIKPANIMFSAAGIPKLADLGIARSGIGTNTTTVTQTGMMIGTPAYMAPEQMLDAHHVDTRADIYSLGVVFFEMLTGERPNKEDTVVQLMAKAVSGQPLPDVRTLRPEVSATVAQVINLMCAPKADERVASPHKIVEWCEKLLNGEQPVVESDAQGTGCFDSDDEIYGTDKTRGTKSVSVAKARISKSRMKKSTALLLSIVGGVILLIGAVIFAYFGYQAMMSWNVESKKSVAVKEVREIVKTNVVEKVIAKTPVVTNEVVKEVIAKALVVTNEVVEKVVENVQAGTNEVEEFESNEKVENDEEVEDSQKTSGITDRNIRYTKVGEYNWFYSLKNGEAILWRGSTSIDTATKPCIEPEPSGEINIPSELDGYKVSVIGPCAFFRCHNITRIVVPEGVRELCHMSFGECNSLTEIVLPKSLDQLIGSTFAKCEKLKSINLRNCRNVTTGQVFQECSSLNSIEIAADNPRYQSVDGSLYSKDGRTLIAYRNATHLQLPKGVSVIGPYAFSIGSLQKDIIIPDEIEKIEHGAFVACSKLRSITLGAGVREVDTLSFAWNSNLQWVIFPKALKKLGTSLFCDCRKLEHIYFKGDAPTLASTDDLLFGANTSDFEILVERGSKGWKYPDSTILPKRWPNEAFEDSCRIRYRDSADDKKKEMVGGNRSVNDSQKESTITDRRIRSTKVGKYNWFYSIENGEAVLWRGKVNNGWDNEMKPCIEPEPKGEIIIPSELDGYKVTIIGDSAFFRCHNITRIVVPEGVRRLENLSFNECISLTEIVLPKSIDQIIWNTFRRCKQMKKINLRNCRDVSGRAFLECSSLNSIEVAADNPNYQSVKGSLYSKDGRILIAYRNAKQLQLPKGVTVIGAFAFSIGSLQGDIIIPDEIERIEYGAIVACPNLKSITIGDGVREVGSFSIAWNINLQWVIFPKALKMIGTDLFNDCYKLEQIYFEGDAPTIVSTDNLPSSTDDSVFGRNTPDFEILVARGSKGWKNPESTDLPKKWPDEASDDSRRIRYRNSNKRRR